MCTRTTAAAATKTTTKSTTTTATTATTARTATTTQWTRLVITVFIFIFTAASCPVAESQNLACRTITDGIKFVQPPTVSGAVIRRTSDFTRIFWKPDLCCGSKPFNSNTHLCCVGKVLRKSKHICCLDGTYVPKESICLCHPPSSWVKNQIKILSYTEEQLALSLVNMVTITAKLQKVIISVEEQVELMDRKAEDFYQELIKLMDETRRADTQEVDYIIKLVVFLNENEESIQSAKKSMSVLSKKISAQPRTSALVPERLKLKSLRSAIQWSRQVRVLITEEIQVSLKDERNIRKTKELVMERDQLLKSVTEKNKVLARYGDHLRNSQALVTVVSNDVRLLVHLQALLDETLTFVTQMEATFYEENSRSRVNTTGLSTLDAAVSEPVPLWRLSIDKMFPNVPTEQFLPPKTCDFSTWDIFLQAIQERLPLIRQDMATLDAVTEDSPRMYSLVKQHFLYYLSSFSSSSKSHSIG